MLPTHVLYGLCRAGFSLLPANINGGICQATWAVQCLLFNVPSWDYRAKLCSPESRIELIINVNGGSKKINPGQSCESQAALRSPLWPDSQFILSTTIFYGLRLRLHLGHIPRGILLARTYCIFHLSGTVNNAPPGSDLTQLLSKWTQYRLIFLARACREKKTRLCLPFDRGCAVLSFLKRGGLAANLLFLQVAPVARWAAGTSSSLKGASFPSGVKMGIRLRRTISNLWWMMEPRQMLPSTGTRLREKKYI